MVERSCRVTQSGETADSIAAMQETKGKGAKIITICNVIGSAATRVSEGTIYTNAGPEIGVASTKAFTTQLTAIYLLSLCIRQLRGDDRDDIRYVMHELSRIPHKIEHPIKSPLDRRAAPTRSSAVIPTRPLAYCIALRRGCDVDQPRDLAKSVTVDRRAER